MRSLQEFIGIVGATCAVVAGYGFWRSGPQTAPTPTQVHALIQTFAARPASTTVDLSELRNSGRFKELSDPSSLLPQTKGLDPMALQAVFQFAKTCELRDLYHESSTLRKTILWHRYLCGIDTELPANFFEMDPLIHPSGSSFVFLGARSQKTLFHDPSWLPLHQNALHLQERIALSAQGRLADVGGLSRFDNQPWGVLKQVSSEAPLIIGLDRVFVAQVTQQREMIKLEYLVFTKAAWDEFLNEQSLTVSSKTVARSCPVVMDGLCWDADSHKLRNFRLMTVIASTLALLCLVGLGVWLIVERALQRSRYARERERVYQTLAHELRTPVTNLKLLVESFRKRYHALPEGAQSDFLTLSGEVQRLERLVRASISYLDPNGSQTVALSIKNVDIKDLARGTVESYDDRVTLVEDGTNIQASVDPYWFSVCLKNLIDNALNHGVAPVTVSLSQDETVAHCAVADCGSTSDTLTQLTRAFAKGSASQGLGLGLTITQSTMRSMGGSLVFNANPTTFTLCLRRSPSP